jgi:hypothetical protein
MSRDYGRVYTAFWKSEQIRALSDRGKLLANYLITSPHSNMVGAYLLPDAYIADDLNWSFETVRQTVSELEKIQFCKRFKDGRHIAICKFLEWNPIENPNVAKAAERLFEQLPQDTALDHVINGLRRYEEHFRKAFPNGHSTVLKRFAEPSRNQEQEPDQEEDPEPEQEQDVLLPAFAGEPIETLAFQFYFEVTDGLDWSQPRDLNAERRTKILARVEQAGGLEGWRAALRRAVASSFLLGTKGRDKAHASWRPNLDFFLQKKSFTKLLEGQYDDRENLCADSANVLDNTLAGIELALGDHGGPDDGPAPTPADEARPLAIEHRTGGEGGYCGDAEAASAPNTEGMGEPLRAAGVELPAIQSDTRTSAAEIPGFLRRPRGYSWAGNSRGLAALSAGTEPRREAEILPPSLADTGHV